jgi:hypothetical protein
MLLISDKMHAAIGYWLMIISIHYTNIWLSRDGYRLYGQNIFMGLKSATSVLNIKQANIFCSRDKIGAN